MGLKERMMERGFNFNSNPDAALLNLAPPPPKPKPDRKPKARRDTPPCKQCGEPVEYSRKFRLYCSDACMDKAGRERLKLLAKNPAPFVQKFCKTCGIKIPAMKKAFCSDECRLINYKEERKPSHPVKFKLDSPCPICGTREKELVNGRPVKQNVYCSTTCSRAGYLRNKKRRYERSMGR